MMIHRLVLTTALTSGLLCAACAHAASPVTYGLQTSDILFNGLTYIPAVPRAEITGRAWRVAVQNAGGVTGKSYSAGYYPPAEFDVGPSGIVALARAITDFSAGRSVRLSTQVRTPSLVAEIPEWTSLGECDLVYVEFPRFDAGNKAAGVFKLSLAPAAFVPMTEKLAGTSAPMAPPATPYRASDFAVSIPGMDGSHVTLVDGVTIESPLHVRETTGRSGVDAAQPGNSVTTNANFRIEANGVSARGLREWMLANQNAGPTKREITIQLFAPGGSTTLLTLHGVGVGLMSVRRGPELNEGVRNVEAELFVERWEVLLPGAPRTKLELAAPGVAPAGGVVPGGRK